MIGGILGTTYHGTYQEGAEGTGGAGAILHFQMFLSLGEIVGFQGIGEPTWDPKTTIAYLRAQARLSEGSSVHLRPHLITVSPVGTHCAPPCPLPTLADIPAEGESAIGCFTKLEGSLLASFALS